VRRGAEHRRDSDRHAAVILLRDLFARLGTRPPTGHFAYFFPLTRDTLPPVRFAYVFAADLDLKTFDPFAVVTLGIVTTLLLLVGGSPNMRITSYGGGASCAGCAWHGRSAGEVLDRHSGPDAEGAQRMARKGAVGLRSARVKMHGLSTPGRSLGGSAVDWP
jgi:hypothetical protein